VRSILTGLLITVVSIAFTLLLAEVAFRIAGVQPIPQVEKEQLSYEKNSHGLRDHERGYEKEEGVFRIVATGDSFTFGTGVPSMDDIFP
jgi:DNA-dependent RNA polymerase auxiliary subunit epsilon